MGRVFQLLVAAIVLVVVIGAGVVMFAGGSELGPFQRRISTQHVLPRQDVRTLRVDASGGNLDISEGTVTQAEIRKSWLARRPRVTSSVDGDGVWTITAKCRGLSLGSCNAHVDVVVPRGTRVTVEHSAGNVHIHDMQSPEIDLDISAGNLTMENVEADKIETESSAGNSRIELDTAPDDLVATSSAGNLTIELPEGAYDVDAEASAGNSNVEIDDHDDATHHVKARTSAGNVTVRRSTD